MCRDLTLVFDCVCAKRVLEIYEKIKRCDCLKIVLFKKLESSFCFNCEQNSDVVVAKVMSVIRHFLLDDKNELFYYNDPLVCIEKIYR